MDNLFSEEYSLSFWLSLRELRFVSLLHRSNGSVSQINKHLVVPCFCNVGVFVTYCRGYCFVYAYLEGNVFSLL